MTHQTRAHTVLMVDDNEEILSTASRLLRMKGMSVITANSPLGASSLAYRHKPTILVLDVMMPALGGDSFARLVKANASLRQLPVLFYSSMEEEQLYRISKQIEGSWYVLKSDGVEALYRAICAVPVSAGSRGSIGRT